MDYQHVFQNQELHLRGGAKDKSNYFGDVIATFSGEYIVDFQLREGQIEWKVDRFVLVNEQGNPFVIEPDHPFHAALVSLLDTDYIEETLWEAGDFGVQPDPNREHMFSKSMLGL